MTKKLNYTELLGVLAVLLVLAGLPLMLWHWRTTALPNRYLPGTKIINLTAIAPGGIWTEELVVGYGYWWKHPTRARDINLEQGDHVVLLLHSPDVQHSFSIPDLNIGPVEIHAGHTVEVEFIAERAGEFPFLCIKICGKDHGRLEGRFLVAARQDAVENSAAR